MIRQLFRVATKYKHGTVCLKGKLVAPSLTFVKFIAGAWSGVQNYVTLLSYVKLCTVPG